MSNLGDACRDGERALTPRTAAQPALGLYQQETSANSARRQNHRRQNHTQSMTQSPTDCAQRGDFATALREWTPLAEQGHATAQYNLGFMYDSGEGVPQAAADAIAKALGGRKAGRGGWIARCPVHDDSNPSLSLSTGKDGKVLSSPGRGPGRADPLVPHLRRHLIGGDRCGRLP